MTNTSTITLACGCFFAGHKFYCDPDCTSHGGDNNDAWSCDNCGETAMDGSGICVTCGRVDEELTPCDCCGREFPLDQLDAKPSMNSRLRRIRAREGQIVMLRRAADLGFQFDKLECRRCYGPGFVSPK